MEPAFLCRGGWHEGEIRGCAQGYAATGIPVEPINTYSNLAYLIAGWVVWRTVGGGMALVFCCTMAFLCFGSALYHGVKTRWSARWDHAGMYAAVGGLAFYVMVAGHPYQLWIMLGGAVLFSVSLAWLLDGNLIARMGVLLALIAVGVVTRGDATMGWYSLACFGGAMVVWGVDKNTSALGRWGHGVWHALTAAALGLMFAGIRVP